MSRRPNIGAAASGLAFFGAVFFAGAGEPDPNCAGPPPPFWIKFAVGVIIGTFKGGIIAVTVLLFKSNAVHGDWDADPEKKKRQMAVWRRNELSFSCLAFGYMFLSAFFVFAFVIILDDKGFARYQKGMTTCYITALILKPVRMVVNQYGPLVLVKQGRQTARKGRQRTWPEIRAARLRTRMNNNE